VRFSRSIDRAAEIYIHQLARRAGRIAVPA
jgi:hypothetical protein